ncbi:MAG: hypothetical protein HY923_09740 [Elusimicrobia bacterium]|nr:hypothetical protein [Elusimicrobiota bacterium]
MKRISLLLVLLLAGPARAGDALLAPVQIAVTGFKAKLADGQVTLTWRRYKREDFKSYAILKSDKDADPAYPGPWTIATFSAPEGVKWVDGDLSAGTWNYRLVITTRHGDRWVSPVFPVSVGEADVRHTPPGDSDFY